MGATRLYRARLSNADVIFVCACAVQSLKGLFQPKAITAAMIKISTNSRRMTTETEQKVRGRSIEFVTSLRQFSVFKLRSIASSPTFCIRTSFASRTRAVGSMLIISTGSTRVSPCHGRSAIFIDSRPLATCSLLLHRSVTQPNDIELKR